MTIPEQLRPDHEGDAWSDAEQERTEGYRKELAKSLKKIREEEKTRPKPESLKDSQVWRDAKRRLGIK